MYNSCPFPLMALLQVSTASNDLLKSTSEHIKDEISLNEKLIPATSRRAAFAPAHTASSTKAAINLIAMMFTVYSYLLLAVCRPSSCDAQAGSL